MCLFDANAESLLETAWRREIFHLQKEYIYFVFKGQFLARACLVDRLGESSVQTFLRLIKTKTQESLVEAHGIERQQIKVS